MNLQNEFEPIRKWAKDRGLYEGGNLKTQTLKLQEEVGELSKAVLEEEQHITDAIGDCIVVLVNIAHFAGLTIEECINASYQEIKARKGKIVNNTFVKDSL